MKMLLAQVAESVSMAQDTIMNLTETAAEGVNVWELAVKGGWIMIVLALLSVVGVYIFIERFTTLRKAVKQNPRFMQRVRDNVKDNDIKSAMNYCMNEDTPIARVVERGLKNINLTAPAIREGLDNSANIEVAALEKGLPILSTIAAVAPMIGFLGTVTGMVQAFWEMANAGNNIDISLLSGGIYEAMVTTVGGLIVGIVAIFAYNFLVIRVDKVQNDLENGIISFMEIVHEKKENI
ncbi:MAG: MotA/TolQ/ExbB proton channel family protein [Bacteroidaceae bacterium]|nr:MotA/TolQ/ExbB proton channel family protein [Bacteroidaceae bacterium]MBQ8450372.1 MotA/TolQ/ExbB proton channel family protein [Bacteroidaceae bacterium]